MLSLQEAKDPKSKVYLEEDWLLTELWEELRAYCVFKPAFCRPVDRGPEKSPQISQFKRMQTEREQDADVGRLELPQGGEGWWESLKK